MTRLEKENQELKYKIQQYKLYVDITEDKIRKLQDESLKNIVLRKIIEKDSRILKELEKEPFFKKRIEYLRNNDF